MKRTRFGADAAQPLTALESNAQVAPVVAVNGQLFVDGLHIPPGGSLAPHKGRKTYLLLVTGGSGWVSTNGGEREPITVGDAISWTVDETREIGTNAGLSGVWVRYALGGFWAPRRQFTAYGKRWTVYLESGNELEHHLCDQLERLLGAHDLSRWAFTTTLRICDGATPHSHPVLTLNTRVLDDDAWTLSVFLHEQIHWFEDDKLAKVEAAMAEFQALYPDAPGQLPDGATNLHSTYLHLIVCPLEYAALVEVIGVEPARQLIGQKPYYTWIYERALNDWDRIHGVLMRHGLII